MGRPWDLIKSGLESGVMTGAGTALAAATGVGVAAVAGEIAGLSYSILTAPGDSGVNPNDLSNGINTIKNKQKHDPNDGNPCLDIHGT